MENPADPRRLRQVIIDLLEADLIAEGFDLVDVRVFRGGGRVQIRVYVDTAQGVTLDGCAAASRTVGMLLEEADPVAGPYVIEVSSPGIRRPLRKADHFAAAVGSQIELKLGPGHEPGRVRGRLHRFDSGQLWLEVAGRPGSSEEQAELTAVDLDQVQEANLDPEFDVQALINADRRARKDARRTQRRNAAKDKQARKRVRKKQADPAPPVDGGEGQTE